MSSERAQPRGGWGGGWGGPPGAEPQGLDWAKGGRDEPEHRAGWRPDTRESTQQAGGPRRHACVPFILGGWGAQKVLGSRVRWSGQLSAEVGLQHSGGGARDKDDMGSG